MNLKSRIPFLPALVAVATLSLFASCVVGGKTESESLPLGAPVPEFTVSGPSSEISAADLAGRPAVVVLFRTTCPDCNREMPNIEEAFKQIGSEQSSEHEARFVAISKEDEATVADYWREAGLTLPWYLDPDGSVFSAFEVHLVPTIYLFGSDGKLTYSAIETFDFSVAELVELIKRLK